MGAVLSGSPERLFEFDTDVGAGEANVMEGVVAELFELAALPRPIAPRRERLEHGKNPRRQTESGGRRQQRNCIDAILIFHRLSSRKSAQCT